MDPQLQLKDIHLPPSPDMWPLALGWWLVLVLFLLALTWLFLVIRKKLCTKKHRKMLLDELAKLEQKLINSPDKDNVTETNVFLRRLALAYYPSVAVASLTGGDWLKFLDESGGTNNFSKGAGQILIDAPYRSGDLENYNGDEFIPLIRSWVTKTALKVGGCP